MIYMNAYDILQSSSFYIRRAWDDKEPENWKFPDRVIFDYELLYIVEGEAIITIDNVEYNARPNDIFLFKPMEVHSIQGINDTPLRQPHVHFDFFYQEDSEDVYIPVWSMSDPGEDIHFARQDVTGPNQLDIPNKIVIDECKKVEILLLELIRECENTNRYSLLRQKALLLQILALILEGVHGSGNRFNINIVEDEIAGLLENARQKIAKQVNEVISIEQLAKEVGVSRNYFSRMFRQQFGQAPGQYHNMLRIQKARMLLSTTDTNITDIANQLGFDSIHSFSRAFKMKVGLSPMKYRQISDISID